MTSKGTSRKRRKRLNVEKLLFPARSEIEEFRAEFEHRNRIRAKAGLPLLDEDEEFTRFTGVVFSRKISAAYTAFRDRLDRYYQRELEKARRETGNPDFKFTWSSCHRNGFSRRYLKYEQRLLNRALRDLAEARPTGWTPSEIEAFFRKRQADAGSGSRSTQPAPAGSPSAPAGSPGSSDRPE